MKCRCSHSLSEHLIDGGPCLAWSKVTWSDGSGEFASTHIICECEGFEEGRAA